MGRKLSQEHVAQCLACCGHRVNSNYPNCKKMRESGLLFIDQYSLRHQPFQEPTSPSAKSRKDSPHLMTLIYTEKKRADITAARRPPSRVWGAQVGGLWPKVAHPQPGGRGVASRLSSAAGGHGSPGQG